MNFDTGSWNKVKNKLNLTNPKIRRLVNLIDQNLSNKRVISESLHNLYSLTGFKEIKLLEEKLTLESPERRSFLVGAAAGIVSLLVGRSARADKKDISPSLARAMKEFGVTELLFDYDPSTDYENLYRDLVKRVADLDFVKYMRKQAVGELNVWKNEKLTLVFDDYSKKDLLWLKNNDDIGFVIPKDNNDYYVNDYETHHNLARGYDPEKIRNQLFYLAHYLLYLTYERELKKFNNGWKKKEWKKLVSRKYKEDFGFIPEVLPYNEKTGEFVFQGADWCKPCKAVVYYLIENKIKFKEKDNPDGGPYVYYQKRRVTGKDKVIEVINEMYGL